MIDIDYATTFFNLHNRQRTELFWSIEAELRELIVNDLTWNPTVILYACLFFLPSPIRPRRALYTEGFIFLQFLLGPSAHCECNCPYEMSIEFEVELKFATDPAEDP